jgi:hypothetical protein
MLARKSGVEPNAQAATIGIANIWKMVMKIRSTSSVLVP